MEFSSPEAWRKEAHSVPRYPFEAGKYQNRKENTFTDSRTPPMGQALPVIDAEIPPEYVMSKRNTLLLNGQVVQIFYAIHREIEPQAGAFEKLSGTVIAAFIWALQTPSFADTAQRGADDDDRSEAIGTIFAYALYDGLSEEEALVCYNTAYLEVKSKANT